MLLQYLRCFCLSKHTDLSIEVDILESFALHIHVLLTMQQISPHPLIVSILSAQRCLVYAIQNEGLGVTFDADTDDSMVMHFYCDSDWDIEQSTTGGL